MEEQHHDDQSHYEISLTAGQAFVAFVLLLLSLAASFAFGLMLGKGQADERLVVQKETPVVTEAALIPKKTNTGEIVELGVENDDFTDTATTVTGGDALTDTAAPATDTVAVVEEGTPVETTTHAAVTETAAPTEPTPGQTRAATAVAALPKGVPHFAQLLSTTDQKVAETLAAKLIDGGFNSAYVERGTATEKGTMYRVRVKFASEQEARTAESRLREFSKDVWITTR